MQYKSHLISMKVTLWKLHRCEQRLHWKPFYVHILYLYTRVSSLPFAGFAATAPDSTLIHNPSRDVPSFTSEPGQGASNHCLRTVGPLWPSWYSSIGNTRQTNMICLQIHFISAVHNVSESFSFFQEIFFMGH